MIENLIPKKDRKSVIIFLVGVITGVIFSISIKYPLAKTEIEKMEKVCKDQKIEKLKVGISGKVYEVKCSDGITYLIGNN